MRSSRDLEPEGPGTPSPIPRILSSPGSLQRTPGPTGPLVNKVTGPLPARHSRSYAQTVMAGYLQGQDGYSNRLIGTESDGVRWAPRKRVNRKPSMRGDFGGETGITRESHSWGHGRRMFRSERAVSAKALGLETGCS